MPDWGDVPVLTIMIQSFVGLLTESVAEYA
jgi:hypothetical protein